MPGIYGLRRFKGKPGQGFVRREGRHVHAGHPSVGVAEMHAVKVVVHGVLAHHQIADVQRRAEGTGNARVHQMGHAEAAAQNLGAQGRVDLAHAALHHHNVHAFQRALAEFAARHRAGCFIVHLAQQDFHFHLHGADNAEFYHNNLHL